MAFCRITGRSRGLPKPHYFPLLPPISPSAAKRYCRITGKSYGLPSHNFIPVILTTNLNKKLQCKITTNDSGIAPLTGLPNDEIYGQRKHILLPDYRYLFPSWDEDNPSQKELLGFLDKQLDEDMLKNNYVYRVDEKSCNLVFPAHLESAIRDGEVRDVMLANDSDRVLLKMHQGKNVSVKMCDWHGDDAKWATLCEGEGPRPEILLERQREEKQKKRRQKKMRHMTKVFEGDDEETPLTRHSSAANQAVNRMGKSDAVTAAIESLLRDKQQFLRQVQGSSRATCGDLVKPLIESWDWKTYEQMANSKFDSKVIVDLPKPIHVEPLVIDRECPKVAASELLENTIGFDAIPHVAPLANFKTDNVMDETVLTSIRRLSAAQLADTENAIEKLETDIEQLPTVDELSLVVKGMQRKSSKLTQLANVKGLKLDISKARDVFVPGQNISTPTGDVFVPGHTVATPGGPVYVPGLTVKTPGGVSFIPGHLTMSPNTEEFEFTAGHIIDDKFVPGQTMGSPTDQRFCEGQTVQQADGSFNFIPGIVHDDQFVCGQTLKTADSEVFVPGQTITTDEGDLFFAGQSVKKDDGSDEWTFVEGQTVKTAEDTVEFIPGKTIKTEEGSKFVPGQTVEENFVPGVCKLGEDGVSKFIPGVNIDTDMGAKFIQGMMVDESEFGPIFMPGTIGENEQGVQEFIVAKSMSEVVTHEAAVTGLVIDGNHAELIESNSSNVFGYTIETKSGNKFVTGKIVETPDGPRFVPGRIVQTRSGPTFIPGQVICTEEGGERFVPGQMVDTDDGPRFVPGRVVEKGDSVTFIPGQVVQTADGPRFVAPDLMDTEEGEQEFSVQSFLVTPEDLKLIKLNGFASQNGDFVMDASPLPHLSEMALQEIREERSLRNIEKAFEESLSSSPVELVKSSVEALKSVIACINGEMDTELKSLPKRRVGLKSIDQATLQTVEEIVKRVYTKMNVTKRPFYEVLEEELVAVAGSGLLKLEDICQALGGGEITLQLVKKLQNEIEVEQRVAELVSICNKTEEEDVSDERFMSVLRRAINDENVYCSLEAVARTGSAGLVDRIMCLIREECEAVGEGEGVARELTNRKLIEIVVGQVQEMINQRIYSLCLDSKSEELNVILTDTIQLAKALEVAPGIINQLLALVELDDNTNESRVEAIKNNPAVSELISRTFLLREIIATRSSSSVTDKRNNYIDEEESENLMEQLRTSPYSIRSNRHFIDVFRKSGSLLIGSLQMSAAENGPLTSSHELPSQVLYNDNPLVIEDYFLKRKTKTRDALVIIKDNYKAVVPRHMSHAVLTGKCSYTLVDENGVRHFEPKNVLEALNMSALKRMPSIKKRFSAYQKPGKVAQQNGSESNGKMNGHCDEDSSVDNEEEESRIAAADEIEGILTMATTTFGVFSARKCFDPLPSHALIISGDFRTPTGHELIYPTAALVPNFITSYRYF